MRIPDGLTKCVGFVSRHSDPLEYCGTAFVVSVPFDERTGILHLVTAKHVAKAMGDHSFVVAFNGADGLPLFAQPAGGMTWYFHPTDEAVDVAILPFGSLNTRAYDIEHIPVEMFATDERIAEYGIGVGDEIVVVGLFSRFFGTSRLFPIVRTGNIAMMPTDSFPSEEGMADIYLAEGRSIGGLSGSPILCRDTVNILCEDASGQVRKIFGLGSFHLLGLMQGHWDTPTDLSDGEGAEAVNMGISVIVPAKKILEVLYSPELVKSRDAALRRSQ